MLLQYGLGIGYIERSQEFFVHHWPEYLSKLENLLFFDLFIEWQG